MMRLETSRKVMALAAPSSGDSGDDVFSSIERGTANSLHPRVLIVEDEGLVAINIESALTEAGFRVTGIVDTEADAVAAADRLRPDIILMDITLREGNGISAARTILKRVHTRIIFVSGNSDPRTLAAAEELNTAGFIRKPFITDRFVRLVWDALPTKN